MSYFTNLEHVAKEGEEMKLDHGTYRISGKLVGHTDVIASIIYFKNLGKLVSCSSDDFTIRIFDVESEVLENTIKKKDGVRELIFWDDEHFVSGDYEGRIESYSVVTFDCVKTIRWPEPRGSFVKKLVKVSSDRIISLVKIQKTELVLYNYNNPSDSLSLLTDIEISIDSYSKFLLSSLNPNIIFLNGSDSIDLLEKDLVLMIDFEANKVLRKIHPPNKNWIYLIHLYVTSRNEEILIISSGGGSLGFYNLQSFTFTHTMKLEKYGARTAVIVRNKYAFFGCGRGFIKLFDLENMKELDVLDGKTRHIRLFQWKFTELELIRNEKNRVILVASSPPNSDIFIIDFTSSKLDFSDKSGLELEDLRTRVEFLRDEKNSEHIFGDLEIRPCICVKSDNFSIVLLKIYCLY